MLVNYLRVGRHLRRATSLEQFVSEPQPSWMQAMLETWERENPNLEWQLCGERI